MYYKFNLILIFLIAILCFSYVNCDNKTNNNNKVLDDYVLSTQAECFTSKKIFSCFRYKAARYIWAMASGQMQMFSNENRDNTDEGKVKLIQLEEPSSVVIFPDARQIPDENETSKIWKFFKRSLQSFVTTHGIHIPFDSELGAQIYDKNDIDETESRGKKKKKKKWLIVLPLAILLKLTHLKLLLLKVLLAVGGVQISIIIGGILLFHYLKHNTLCKIQPHLVHSHSHITEHEPEVSYSSYPSYGGHSYSLGGQSNGAYNKDWSTNRAYSAYIVNKE